MPTNVYKTSDKDVENGVIPTAGMISVSDQKMSSVANANVVAGKYDLSFQYSGNGQIDITSQGVSAKSSISQSLQAGPSWKKLVVSLQFTNSGVHTLCLKCDSGKFCYIKSLSLTANTDDAYDPALIIIAASNDCASSISSVSTSAIESLGGKLLSQLRTGGSYILVFDALNGVILDEKIDNKGHVKFISDGQYPVFGSSYYLDSTNPASMYLMHRDTVINYDFRAGKVNSSTSLQKSNLPSPFNQQIDTVIDMKDDTGANTGTKSLILTRGRFWIKVKPDLNGNYMILGGPDIIGSPGLPLNMSPFNLGLNAHTVGPDGARYFFKNSEFVKTSYSMENILEQGELGDPTKTFSGLPTAFKKIHSAISNDQNIGLLSFDSFCYYNPVTKLVTAGPVSVLTDARFRGLPLSFKRSKISAPTPFLNHTIFEGQRLKNIDIAIPNADGFRGWNPSCFSSFNLNVVANYYKAPIKVKAVIDMYPDVARNLNNDTNQILTAYEKSNWQVPRFGGNTISFQLKDKKSSFWQSHSDSGDIYNNAKMIPGEWMILSVWARTEDSELKIGAYTGSNSNTQSITNVNMAPLTVNSLQGWQLLSWEFHNPSFSDAADVSFTFSQATGDNSMHSLYGPILKPRLRIASSDYIEELIGLRYFYILSSAVTRLGVMIDIDKNKMSVYTCSQCSSVNGQYGLNERLTAYKRISGNSRPGSLIIGSYATTQQASHVPYNMTVDKTGNLSFDTTDDESALWLLVRDDDLDLNYFIHYQTDYILQVASDGTPSVMKSPQSSSDLTRCGFKIQLQKAVEGFDIAPRSVYIEAASTRRDNGSEVFLFRKGIVSSYDVQNDMSLITPSKLADTGSFQNFPHGFENIDTAFVRSGSELILTSGDSFILWDTVSGGYGSVVNGLQKLGPGGHILFNKLPAPFSKYIDASFKLDASTVCLISNGMWIRWNLTTNQPLDDPAPLTSGIFVNLDANFKATIDACVEVPGQFGQAFIFNSSQWMIFDFINGRAISGPYLMGPSGTHFTQLSPPFIPSQAEICQGYKDIILRNTDFPKDKCMEDPNREFQWFKKCMFNVPSCDDAKGIYNTNKGYCGTLISKGDLPLRQIDTSIRNSYTQKYYTQCEKVSEWDYLAMKKKEQAKQQDQMQARQKEEVQKLALMKRLDTEQANLDQLNKQLEAARVELIADDDRACHPLVVCLKSIDMKGSRKIPLSCNPQLINDILSKPNMTAQDVQVIINVMRQNGIINEYPIEQHPDYAKYADLNSKVQSCDGGDLFNDAESGILPPNIDAQLTNATPLKGSESKYSSSTHKKNTNDIATSLLNRQLADPTWGSSGKKQTLPLGFGKNAFNQTRTVAESSTGEIAASLLNRQFADSSRGTGTADQTIPQTVSEVGQSTGAASSDIAASPGSRQFPDSNRKLPTQKGAKLVDNQLSSLTCKNEVNFKLQKQAESGLKYNLDYDPSVVSLPSQLPSTTMTQDYAKEYQTFIDGLLAPATCKN